MRLVTRAWRFGVKYPSHPDTLADRDAFRANRREGIYSTDSPAILGLSRWHSPLSVWLSKVQDTEPEGAMSLQAFLGHQLEDALGQLYNERFPEAELIRFTDKDEIIYAPDGRPILRTHLDFMRSDEPHPVVVECKTRGRRSDEWGEDGSAKVPVDIWVQTQHEMMVTKAIRADVPVLFGLYTFNVFHVPRDDEFIEQLQARLLKWWDDYVVANVQPPMVAHEIDVQFSKRWEQTEPGLRSATPTQEALFRDWRAARVNAGQVAKVVQLYESQVRDLIGPAEGIMGSFGEVTYRKAKDSVDRHWDMQAGTYRQMAEELLEMAAPGDDPALVARLGHIQQLLPMVGTIYNEVKPGSRRLNVTFTEDEGEE